jgi:RNA polymerase sigma factor (sigma-70 family)
MTVFDLAKRCKPLPDDQLRELARRYRAGDRQAGRTSVQSCVRLVVGTVRRLVHDEQIHEDLVQEGVLGLMRALETFDPDRADPATGRPIRFTTYAAWWMQCFINRARACHGRAKLYVPVHVRERAIDRAQGRHAPENDNARELAADLAMRPNGYVSLDDDLFDAGPRLGDTIADEDAVAPDEAAETRSTFETMRRAIDAADLSERERALIEHRLLAEEPVTFRVLGQSLGVSDERMRQHQALLLRRLRGVLLSAGVGGDARTA